YVNEQGRVGIGTANPAHKLEVHGNTRLGAGIDYGSEVVLSAAPGVINFDAHGISGGRFKIDSVGNVGIGTTNPTEKLEVAGTVKAEKYLLTDGTEITAGDINKWQGIGDIYYTDGNVGIGITDPGANKLSVNGNTHISGNLGVNGTISTRSTGLYNNEELLGFSVHHRGHENSGNKTHFSASTEYSGGTSPSYHFKSTSQAYAGFNNMYHFYSSMRFDAPDYHFYAHNGYTNKPIFYVKNAYAELGKNPILYHCGSVGIGTEEPSSRLDVIGTGHFSGALNLDSSLVFSSDTNLYRSAENTLKTDDKLIVADSIGIGTGEPAEKLEIAGNVKAQSFIGDGSQLTGISAGKWQDSENGNIYFDKGMIWLTGQNENNANLPGLGIFGGTTGAGMYFRGDDNEKSLGFGVHNGDIRFNVGNGAVNEAVRITSSGNVGIGTAEPYSKLEVVGTVKAKKLEIQNTVGQSLKLYDGDSHLMGIFDSPADPYTYLDFCANGVRKGLLRWSPSYFSMEGDNGADIRLKGWGGNIIMDTNQADHALIIKNNGNVGIGTAEPYSKLEVVGTVKAKKLEIQNTAGQSFELYDGDSHIMGTFNSPADPYTYLNFCADGTRKGFLRWAPSYFSMEGDNGADIRLKGWGGNIIMDTNQADHALIIKNNGNVGIGTANPTEKLEVAGTVKANSFSGDGSGITGIKTAGPMLRISNDQESIEDTFAERLRVVARSAGYDGNHYGPRISFNSIWENTEEQQNAFIGAYNGYAWTSGLVFAVKPEGRGASPITRMTILDTGNVGIGTENPTEKLDVNGTIVANEVKVSLDRPADYVFKADYNLMPLDRVEQNIKELGHLPGLPSAEEIIDKGLSLGQMQNKLLEKIEELTLYVISQNKKIEDYTKKTDSQKREIEQLKRKIR
ncbi:hypothetical protein ACFL4O_03215, partial [bacterium]